MEVEEMVAVLADEKIIHGRSIGEIENFCTLGEFATIYIQHAIITEDDDFSRTERKFFVKRDHNVREFR